MEELGDRLASIPTPSYLVGAIRRRGTKDRNQRFPPLALPSSPSHTPRSMHIGFDAGSKGIISACRSRHP